MRVLFLIFCLCFFAGCYTIKIPESSISIRKINGIKLSDQHEGGRSITVFYNDSLYLKKRYHVSDNSILYYQIGKYKKNIDIITEFPKLMVNNVIEQTLLGSSSDSINVLLTFDDVYSNCSFLKYYINSDLKIYTKLISDSILLKAKQGDTLNFFIIGDCGYNSMFTLRKSNDIKLNFKSKNKYRYNPTVNIFDKDINKTEQLFYETGINLKTGKWYNNKLNILYLKLMRKKILKK